jgi:hypothetical protein
MLIVLIVIGSVLAVLLFLFAVFACCVISGKADYWIDKEYPESGEAITKPALKAKE